LVSTSLLLLFDAPAPSVIYTLSLHDALPISMDAFRAERSSRVKAGIADVRFIDDNRHKIAWRAARQARCRARTFATAGRDAIEEDRKSTRLNSSHVKISYAVFCLKKKKTQTK